LRPYHALEHPRFRAGYDLLFLRAEAGEPVLELYDWWTQFNEADQSGREKMLKETMNKPRSSRKRRKPRKFSRKFVAVKNENLS
jgi:poly(A) polymerase